MVRCGHQCGPGSISARCHTWVEFLLGSHLAPTVFLRVIFIALPSLEFEVRSRHGNYNYKLQLHF